MHFGLLKTSEMSIGTAALYINGWNETTRGKQKKMEKTEWSCKIIQSAHEIQKKADIIFETIKISNVSPPCP